MLVEFKERRYENNLVFIINIQNMIYEAVINHPLETLILLFLLSVMSIV